MKVLTCPNGPAPVVELKDILHPIDTIQAMRLCKIIKKKTPIYPALTNDVYTMKLEDYDEWLDRMKKINPYFISQRMNDVILCNDIIINAVIFWENIKEILHLRRK